MKLITCIFLLLFPNVLLGQINLKNDLKFGVLDIGFNGLVGGIGASINKKPNQSFGKIFIKGFWQGSIGGGFNYFGKKIATNYLY